MQMTAPVSDWLVDKLDPHGGQTILEIAAGTGDLGFRVAEHVGQLGRVISTDFAREMIGDLCIGGAGPNQRARHGDRFR
jgi:ubiquinone/menaquinone biosynthesis C-methylase UbiE